MTGWRLGYCLAPQDLMAKIKNVHQYVTFAAATPLQLAVSSFLEEESSYLGLSSFFETKRDLFLEAMKDTNFQPIASKGTYFQLMQYDRDLNDFAFAEELVKKHKVATIPMSYFYHDKTDHHILRFCFAKNDDELELAAENLKGD